MSVLSGDKLPKKVQLARKELLRVQEDNVEGLSDANGIDIEGCNEPTEVLGHTHHSHRSPWLRAAVLGANDGLVSTAALLVGMVSGGASHHVTTLAGVTSLVAGACSMAMGEYVSVATQKDAEVSDIKKEITAQMAGKLSREKELKELADIYVNRGLSEDLALQVAVQLTEKDVLRAHARDELGIDLDDLSSPLVAAIMSCFTFAIGASLPLIPTAIIENSDGRLLAIIIVALVGLSILGAVGAFLGGASVLKGSFRVTFGGACALAVTYLAGLATGSGSAV